MREHLCYHDRVIVNESLSQTRGGSSHSMQTSGGRYFHVGRSASGILVQAGYYVVLQLVAHFPCMCL